MTGIDENDTKVSCRSTRYHVSCILYMSRSVSNDKFPLGSSKVAIGHIDGDALLTLGTQAVSQQGEVDLLVAT